MKKHLLLSLVMLGAGLAAFLLWPTRVANTSLPNIVLIVADDIGYGDYGFAGHPDIKTPHLDTLAMQGVVFNNAYTVNAICRPSLASLITGLYPSQHQITVNARIINKRREPFEFGLPPYAKRMDELDTLPKQLAKLGYRSLQAGKWWEEGYATGGFDEGDKKAEGIFRHVTRRNVVGREGLEPVLTFIDENKQQPFFIWYAPQMPHVPHNPPDHFLQPYQHISDERIARYYGMVSWFDETVGQIVAHLEQQDLRNNTLVVYVTDNGYSLTADVLNDGSQRGKDSPYEAGVRQQIIFNWPAHWPAAARKDLVSTIDVFPTLMALLQREPAHLLPGTSLLAGLQDSSPLARHAVAGEGYLDQGKESFDNTQVFRWLRFREADNSNWKLIEFADGRHELYQLDHDAAEQHNLAGDPMQAARLRQALTQLHNTLHQEETP